MKTNKPLCLILFGIAVILSTIGFTVRGSTFAVASLFIVPAGLLICLVGLIWALKQK